jgi:hypothetical protein
MTNTVEIISVNHSVEPIITEKFKTNDGVDLNEFFLKILNDIGHSAHLLVKKGNEFWTVYHTSPRGPSKKCFVKRNVIYHPLIRLFEKNEK